MRHTGLEEAQAGIKIAGRHINNLRYADDTTLMAEIEEELKSLLMLGAGALGRPRGMVWGGKGEEGSAWGTHVYLWRIHFDVWQN